MTDAESRLASIARGEHAWFDAPGSDADVILSTRIRLARNLDGVRFPWRATPEERQGVLDEVLDGAGRSGVLGVDDALLIADLGPLDRQVLLERHLVSTEFTQAEPGRALILSEDDGLSVMVNEEDHLRIQGIRAGLQLQECWERVLLGDTALSRTLDFAWSNELGYLTTCPSNVGTGLRVSVLAHLPSLVLTGEISRVVDSVSQIGLTVRGFYGEHTDVVGHFFQISNQLTLGKSEEELLDILDQVAREVIRYEADARSFLWTNAEGQISDRIYRAFGALERARMLSADEVVAHASALRLGISLGMDEMPRVEDLNAMVVRSQPAHLSRMAGRALSTEERRRRRADLVRSLLGSDPRSNGEI
jgi:protein arginine kinase